MNGTALQALRPRGHGTVVEGAAQTLAPGERGPRNHVLAIPSLGLFAVASGEGDGLAAEVAAAAAIRAVRRTMAEPADSSPEFGPPMLRRAFTAAAGDLFRINDAQRAYDALGCRLAVMLVGRTHVAFGTHDAELHLIRDREHRRFPVSSGGPPLGMHPHAPPAILTIEHRPWDTYVFGSGPAVEEIDADLSLPLRELVNRWLERASARSTRESSLVAATVGQPS